MSECINYIFYLKYEINERGNSAKRWEIYTIIILQQMAFLESGPSSRDIG